MIVRARRLLDRGLGAGLLAGLTAALGMMALRFAVGAPSLQELISEKLLAYLSPQAFEFLLEQFWSLGKTFAVLGVTAALTASGGVLGLAYGWSRDRLPPWVPVSGGARLLTGLSLGLILWALTSMVLVPLLGGGVWGNKVPGGAGGFSLVTFLSTGLYGVLLVWLMPKKQPELVPTETGMTRRAFLGRAVTWMVILGAAGFGIRALASSAARMAGSTVSVRDAGAIPPEITPNDRFYHVSKNFVDPEVNGATWKLQVDGIVDSPYTLTLEELRAVPAVEQTVTLECISNLVGGDLISNARWKGVPLRALLERAGLQPGVVRVTFRSADGYTESIPLEEAMRPEVMVAYEMNGVPLPSDHGYPARIIYPNHFGMKGPKWLKQIATTDDAGVRGYWERQGWDDWAEVLTTSQVLAPADGIQVPIGATLVGGLAFSGAKGISRVEFSDDGGRTWLPARLKPALSPYSWAFWTTEWKPAAPGRHRLAVRTYAADGAPQEQQPHDAAPSGATGYHIVDVVVLPSAT
ncbi:MAG: hypothetical protein EXR48_01225 [Dehalococcoidia bacterium]|nr:hypothetical protein [Dehalococcoidia bacterium]